MFMRVCRGSRVTKYTTDPLTHVKICLQGCSQNCHRSSHRKVLFTKSPVQKKVVIFDPLKMDGRADGNQKQPSPMNTAAHAAVRTPKKKPHFSG